MAKRPTITTVSSGFASNTQLNANFTAIREAFDNTLSLDGSTPNAMQADLDLNGFDLLNVGAIDADSLSFNGQQIVDLAAVPEWRSSWLTATSYVKNDLVKQAGSSYICLVAHTSGTFSTDLSAGRWELFAEKGAAGAGTGDMVGANNLSDVANAATARVNLGAQASNANLTSISSLVDPNADRILFWDDSASAFQFLTIGTGLTITGTTISAAASGVPAGAVMPFAMSTAPTGWLEANGGAVSRTTYADLFAAIGTLYGAGDGSTTFNLPDLRAEFIRGWDNSRGVDTGRVFGSTQTSQNLAHTHTVTDPGHTHAVTGSHVVGGNNIATNSPNGAFNTSSAANTSATTGITLQNSGGTEARPRNIALMYCIKV